ncbi:MAG: nicotinate-nucleotide adenylyltransferase [Gemmatimonadota bacterium]
MRIGLFGGTFDPPHVGHIVVASDAFESLSLDQLVFIPNAIQPLKADSRQAGPRERLEMTRLATAGDSRFAVDDSEVERGGLSYTVDTLRRYRSRFVHDELFFLVGADVRGTFSRWREPERIVELAHIAVLNRGGNGQGAKDALAEISTLGGGHRLEPVVVATRRIDISSTEVRERISKGLSIRGFVPDAVAEFVGRSGLYRQRTAC